MKSSIPAGLRRHTEKPNVKRKLEEAKVKLETYKAAVEREKEENKK